MANTHQDVINYLSNLNDQELLIMHAWQLKKIFNNEIAAIKNIDHQFVDFTSKFAEAFECTEELIGKTEGALPTVDKADYVEIERQERQIMQKLELQTSIYAFKKNEDVVMYIVRKRPLVNPSTKNCIGILINIGKMVPGALRSLFVNKSFPRALPSKDLSNIKLTDLQIQVIFCLLTGFQTRKEISSILNKVTSSVCNEIKVKNILRSLYNEFGCSTPTQLLDVVTLLLANGTMPAGIFPTGNHPISDLYDFEV